jgi:Mg-chelatase subunit ChlD
VHVSTPALLILLILVVWFWRTGRSSIGKGPTISRCVVAVLLVLAVAGLRIRGGAAPLSVMFVVDRSDSVSGSASDSLERVRKLTETMRSGDRAGLVVFGADAVVERGLASSFTPQAINAVVSPTGTNIDAALKTARIGLASAEAARIVLLSDGRETRGDARAEAARAAASSIPIDVEGVSAEHGSAPRVVQLHAPSVVHVEEPFTVVATVRGMPGSTSAVTLQSEGDTPIEQKVLLSSYGVGTVSFTGRSRQAGIRVYRASARSLVSDALSDFQNPAEQAGAAVVVAGTPRLLYVSATGSGPRASLAAGGYAVSATTTLPRSVAQLDQYEAVVLDDVAADMLDAAQANALEEYVQRYGGGLFMLGSPRSLDPALIANTPFDRLLPIDVRRRSGQRSDDLALVVIFDKSGSMDDQVAGARKIDFARQSIQRALESVSATDAVGVIAFDAGAVPIAPLRAGQDAQAIAEKLRSLAPGGATAIAPAAELARVWLNATSVDLGRRHVLLISDGQTSAEDAARLRALVAERRFTLSVVALGGERDRQLLTSLSQSSGGQAFFPEDIRQVPVLVAREVTRVAGGRLVQSPFTVRPSSHAVLSGIVTASWPQLGGYVASAARPGAETPLRSHLDDPILATWRIGLGRVGVYTADLSSRWSDGLRAWRGFDQLMAQTLRWLSRRVDDDLLSVRMQPTDEGVRIVLDAYGPDDAPLNLAEVRATLRRPSGATEEIHLLGSAPGQYHASVSAVETGAHAVTVDAFSGDRTFERHITRAFYFSGEREYRSAGIDRDLLDTIARTTGGASLGSGDSPFGMPRPSTYVDARPWLVAGALLLFLIEIIAPAVAARQRARRVAAIEAGATPSREDAA